MNELGAEKCCGRCHEWWPADREFFYSDAKRPDGLFYACIACCADLQRATRQRKKALSDYEELELPIGQRADGGLLKGVVDAWFSRGNSSIEVQ